MDVNARKQKRAVKGSSSAGFTTLRWLQFSGAEYLKIYGMMMKEKKGCANATSRLHFKKKQPVHHYFIFNYVIVHNVF